MNSATFNLNSFYQSPQGESYMINFHDLIKKFGTEDSKESGGAFLSGIKNFQATLSYEEIQSIINENDPDKFKVEITEIR